MGLGAGLASRPALRRHRPGHRGGSGALAVSGAKLPIMIATLGCRASMPGLVALVHRLRRIVAGAIEPFSGVLFGLTIALPASRAWPSSPVSAAVASRLETSFRRPRRRPLRAAAPERVSAERGPKRRLASSSRRPGSASRSAPSRCSR